MILCQQFSNANEGLLKVTCSHVMHYKVKLVDIPETAQDRDMETMHTTIRSVLHITSSLIELEKGSLASRIVVNITTYMYTEYLLRVYRYALVSCHANTLWHVYVSTDYK